MDRGVLPREPFESLNRDMARDYAAGAVSAQAFCDFYIGTLAGRSADDWQALRRDYIDSRIVPRIADAALELVARHRDAGDLVLLTTATCRFLSELTAVHLGIAQLIATECETGRDGRFTGRSLGVLNMREGKVQRLHDWLAQQQLELAELRVHAVQRFDQRPAAAQRRAARGGGEPGRAPGRRGGAARLAGHLTALSAGPCVPSDDDCLPLLVVTTLATREQALALGREMVERRLAACAQVSAIDSVYRWNGAVEQDAEFRLLLKTRPRAVRARSRPHCANATPTSCRRSMPSPRRRPTRPMPRGCSDSCDGQRLKQAALIRGIVAALPTHRSPRRCTTLCSVLSPLWLCWRRRCRPPSCRSSTPMCTTATMPGTTLPPKEAVAILRKAGLKRALVSSSGDDGTQRLRGRGAGADRAVAAPLPHRAARSAAGCATTASSPSSKSGCATRAMPRSASSTSTAPMPSCRCRGAWWQLAKQHELVLHAHSDADAIERLFKQDPQARILWAHSGFERPEKVAELLRKHKNLWCDLAFRSEHGSGGKVPAEWRALFTEFPDRFMVGTDTFTPERWYYVVEHAQLVARLAGRPAATAGRTHRLAQRRGAVLVLEGGRRAMTRALAGAALAWRLLAGAARRWPAAKPWARPTAAGSRTAQFAAGLQAAPDAGPGGPALRHRLRAVPARPGRRCRPKCASMRTMPEHKHGMNYRPSVTRAGRRACTAPKG